MFYSIWSYLMCHLWIPFPRLQAFLNSWELVMDWTFVTPEDSCAEALTPDVICIWRWGLWEVIRCTWGHEGRGSHDVIIVLTKRGTETRQVRSLSYGSLTRVRIAGNRIFNPPGSTTVQNRYLLLQSPHLCDFVIAAWADQYTFELHGEIAAQWSSGNPFHILRISCKNRLNITTHSIYTIKLRKFVF